MEGTTRFIDLYTYQSSPIFIRRLFFGVAIDFITRSETLKLGNRSYLYPRYWTGTSMQRRFMRGNIIKKRLMSFTFEDSLH